MITDLEQDGAPSLTRDAAHSNQPPPASSRMAIAATFTAEPISEAIEFWAHELNLPVRVEHASYGQVFQELLHPQSLFRANVSGANVVLLRAEDWMPQPAGPACPALSHDIKRQRLPNGVEIAHLN